MRLHRMLFQESIQDQHNATRDVVATARCFFELLRTEKYTIQDPNLSRDKHEEIVRNINEYYRGQVTPHYRPHINLRAKSEELAQ